MFGLFKRTKIENWEMELLSNVLMKLPKEYSNLMNQINDGLFRGVLVNVSDIPGYVAFTFNSNVLKKYDRVEEKDFKISNIKVYDNKSLSFIVYNVYILSGTISGYSLSGGKVHNIDVSKIDISDFKKELIGESIDNRILDILDEEDKKLLNLSKVYSVFIGGKEYLNIKDLEDGDFIGIDEKKNVYKITHDPMEVVIINRKLSEVLNNSN